MFLPKSRGAAEETVTTFVLSICRSCIVGSYGVVFPVNKPGLNPELNVIETGFNFACSSQFLYYCDSKKKTKIKHKIVITDCFQAVSHISIFIT